VVGSGEGVGGATVGRGVAGVSVGDAVGEAIGDAVGATVGGCDGEGEGVKEVMLAVGVPETAGPGLEAGAPHAATKARIMTATSG
jgi:hypothetical protein